MLTIRLASHEDVVDIAERLRDADLTEIRAAGHSSPEDSLLLGLGSEDPCYVAVDCDGRAQVIFGTNPSHTPLVGWVWMMATDEIRSHKVQIVRQTHEVIERLGSGYRVLGNAVHADNRLHIRWLRWAGFSFLKEFTFHGNRFYEFAKIMRSTHV